MIVFLFHPIYGVYMLKKLSTYFIGFFLSVSIFAYTSDNENSIPEINYSKFTLDNGLTVIVHEDRKVPMVAVNIWYHVGSKNEKEGKTGFAHLFEHLMFMELKTITRNILSSKYSEL